MLHSRGHRRGAGLAAARRSSTLKYPATPTPGSSSGPRWSSSSRKRFGARRRPPPGRVRPPPGGLASRCPPARRRLRITPWFAKSRSGRSRPEEEGHQSAKVDDSTRALVKDPSVDVPADGPFHWRRRRRRPQVGDVLTPPRQPESKPVAMINPEIPSSRGSSPTPRAASASPAKPRTSIAPLSAR